VLSILNHRLVRNSKHLHAWVQFLRTGRSQALERTEWTAEHELHVMPYTGSGEPELDRLDAFVRLLRARPDVLALMGLSVLDPITSKLKARTETCASIAMCSRLIVASLSHADNAGCNTREVSLRRTALLQSVWGCGVTRRSESRHATVLSCAALR
jgi:hypothetical protein